MSKPLPYRIMSPFCWMVLFFAGSMLTDTNWGVIPSSVAAMVAFLDWEPTELPDD